MFSFLSYYKGLEAIAGNEAFSAWFAALPGLLEQTLHPAKHGDVPRWRELLRALPVLHATRIELNAATVAVGGERPLSADGLAELETTLRAFMPWRKGPFDLHGVTIDTEWRSDLKWDRLAGHIAPLQDRLVLDVGCGNGYHCWRMAGAGARAVIGIDPGMLYVMQFLACQHFLRSGRVFVLPFALEDLPAGLRAFDTVFSMGVLYHRRSPSDHLLRLRDCLAPGGELVLETLVIDGGAGDALKPRDRYAGMRNVWCVPSCETVMLWLKNAGFADIRLLDVSLTTPEEQRVTPWSGEVSLRDFLDPADPALTIEGYPAPKRAVFRANTD